MNGDVQVRFWSSRLLSNKRLTISSSHPGAEMGSKGPAVRRLKWYVSWVQNVVRQFGPYLLFMMKI